MLDGKSEKNYPYQNNICKNVSSKARHNIPLYKVKFKLFGPDHIMMYNYAMTILVCLSYRAVKYVIYSKHIQNLRAS